MKKLIILTILTISTQCFAEKWDLKYSKKRNLLLSWKPSFSTLNDGYSKDIDLIGIEGYTRYALNPDFGLNFSLTKFLTTTSNYSNSNSVGTRISLGSTFSLSGSLINKTNYFKKELRYQKENKYTRKVRVYKQKKPTDGWKVDLTVSHMDFNIYNKGIVAFGSSLYYEHILDKLNLQYGIRYDKSFSSDKNIDVNFVQGFIGIGFMP